MLYLSGKIKKLDLISTILVVGAVLFSFILIRSYYEDQIQYLKRESVLYQLSLNNLKKKVSMPRYPFATNYERKDYHDYEFMELEARKQGPGEQGEPYLLTDSDDIERNKELHKQFGFYGIASDHISVNRSLPDVRLPR